MRSLVFSVVSLLATVACHKATTGGGGGDDMGTPDAPSLVGEKYTITWGPVMVPPGMESTQCIWVKLPNTGVLKVHQMHNVLSSSSHHLIVYKDDKDTVEQTTPVACQPFTGALNTAGNIAPLAITQKKDDQITLPDGVAYYLGANQMMKVEMHYINSTDTDQVATATVDLYAADPATIHDEAGLLFAGSPDIDILPGQDFMLHQYLTMPASLDLSAAHVFAITGHTHRLGTNVQINVSPSKTGPMTPVYTPAPFVWSEPVTQAQTPDFSVPKGGGFDFTCNFHNDTQTEVKFGESANNEMCFFWAYYWPSQGSRVCFHTAQQGGHDVCCPGDALCAFLQL
jgi:hypothetical protein